MADPNSAERAGEPLHQINRLLDTRRRPNRQSPNQRRGSRLKGGHGGCGSPAVRSSFWLYRGHPQGRHCLQNGVHRRRLRERTRDFVAPRVPGQVVRVLVDDNNRVRKGNLLVQLDKEPYG